MHEGPCCILFVVIVSLVKILPEPSRDRERNAGSLTQMELDAVTTLYELSSC